MSAGALAVHGLTDQFLADKPCFRDIADELHDFFGDAKLIAHNAAFDFGFLNAEFGRTRHPALVWDRIVDTLTLARRKHPGASNSLDALCQRYGIDNSRRTKHGALLDAELLAEIYVELIGGRQADLGLVIGGPSITVTAGAIVLPEQPRGARPARPALAEAEIAAHIAFVASLGGSPIWRDYVSEDGPA
jgi:DNA polymerase-3 subunit epsilon